MHTSRSSRPWRRKRHDKATWDYELDDQGYAKVDDTWQNPRCVINLLREHVERHTPEIVSRICGRVRRRHS
jgi:formate dehydrogenase major subunit